MERIERAAGAAGRSAASVRLLAVSKTHPAELLAEAFRAGQAAFGENYVQEAVHKMDALARSLGGESARALEWHLVGPLQSNKTRLAAQRFDWVHTIGAERTARRLSEQRPAALPPLNVLIQVNSSEEASKSGVAAQDVPALARAVDGLAHLRLRGLMSIPEPARDRQVQRARYRPVRELFERLREELIAQGAQGLAFDTLSLGMSDDLEAAIAEGSTLVRVGTAIFGPREQGAARASPRTPLAV
jgi:pyridoxal phosphate enzyme (YggS family)